MKKIDVKHIAKLANLPLTPDEEKKFEGQLENTLEYIEQLKEIPTENIKGTNQVNNLENVMDEDTPHPSLTQEDALKNSKSLHNGMFKVDAILEDSV